MDKWEYHYLLCDPQRQQSIGELNTWGKEGWEAVGFCGDRNYPAGSPYFVLLKRNLIYSQSPDGLAARKESNRE